jgi:hypothetical protein
VRQTQGLLQLNHLLRVPPIDMKLLLAIGKQ